MSDQPSTPEPSALEKTQALLASLWQRNLPTLRQRLDTLDQAVAVEPIAPGLLNEAIIIAHKLSGSLGLFGHHHATEIARELEHLFRNPSSAAPGRTKFLTQELRTTLALPEAPPTA